MTLNDYQPEDLSRDGDGITIRWSDGETTTWTAVALRKACPCATCREKKRADQDEQNSKPFGLPVLSASEAQPLSIQAMRPVGGYAYNISFSDGHSSGIYTFAVLRRDEK